MAQPLDPLSPALPPRPPARHRVPGLGRRRQDDTADHGGEDVRDQEGEDIREDSHEDTREDTREDKRDDSHEDNYKSNRENRPDAGELTYDDRMHGPSSADETDAPGRHEGGDPLIDDYA
ncbi:MAG: hypothetical protein ABR612_09045 [Chromatocurvus sp.]